MASPTMTATEERSYATFIALMWSMAHPGRPRAVPATGIAAFGAVADALIDLETSYCTDDDALVPMLARNGAQRRPPQVALYQFYPVLHEAALPVLSHAPVGSYEYPDESATLILGCVLGAGHRLRLRGPGINGTTELWVGGLPEAFWSLRERACRHPLGWDTFLLSGGVLVGLPRTTCVEVE